MGTLSFSLESSHKEKVCSHQSKFLTYRVDPILGRLRPPGKHTGNENCLPLKTWWKQMMVLPYTLRCPNLSHVYGNTVEHMGMQIISCQ